MRTARVRIVVLAGVLGATTPVLAQHDAHQTAGAPPSGVSPALVSTCVDSQRQTLAVIDMADRRLEAARQSNSASEMRAVLADLQRGLLEARMALGRCTELQQAFAAASAQPSLAITPVASAPPPGAAQQPAGHTMVMVQSALDPAKLSCSPKIDRKETAKTTYQGKTYYFCSVKERDDFLTDPAMSLSMMPPK